VTEVLVAFALKLPVANLLPEADVVRLVTAALTESSVRAVTEGHVKAAWHRQETRARQAQDTVGDALPASAVKAIETILDRNVGPQLGWLQGAVEPKLMTALIAPIVQQVLLGFVTRLPGTLGNSSASLMGMLGRGVQQRASALADVGKAVMGGIGVDVEKKLQNAAKDFSQSASSTIRDAIRARLTSAEGRDLLRQISAQVFAHVRRTPVHVIQDDVARLPIDEIVDMVPAILAHNRLRPLIDAAIHEEVRAALAVVGEQTIGDLLTAHQLRDAVEDLARRIVPPTLSQFFAEPSTIALVHELLTPTPE
jgi:hypothetical protein